MLNKVKRIILADISSVLRRSNKRHASSKQPRNNLLLTGKYNTPQKMAVKRHGLSFGPTWNITTNLTCQTKGTWRLFLSQGRCDTLFLFILSLMLQLNFINFAPSHTAWTTFVHFAKSQILIEEAFVWRTRTRMMCREEKGICTEHSIWKTHFTVLNDWISLSVNFFLIDTCVNP